MDCVEVEGRRKSTLSPNAANCVEVAGLGGRVAVRDSKEPDGPILLFEPVDWTTFVTGAREGRYELT